MISIKKVIEALAKGTAAYAYVNDITAKTITASGTDQQININSVVLNEQSSRYFEYDSTHHGIKCKKACRVMLSCQTSSNNATEGDLMGITIYINGQAAIGPEYNRMGGNYDRIALLPSFTSLQAGDYLTIYARNNTSARGSINTMRFAIVKMGEIVGGGYNA